MSPPAQLLLVEAVDSIRGLLQKALRRQGYVVAGFSRAVEAMAHLAAGFQPQVVIANLQTEEGRLLEAELKRSPVLSLVPVLGTAGDAGRIAERVGQLLGARLLTPDQWDSVGFIVGNYETMAAQLPSLLARMRELGAAAGTLAEVEASLKEAERGGRHARSYARYLREYGHAAEEPRVPTDVARALDSALETAEHQITTRARLVREIGPLPLVVARERQLRHVFVSLLVNGAQSIVDGGADGGVEGGVDGNVDAQRLHVSARTDENGWAIVEISDSGSGIAPEVLPQIFEPYFSTKRGAGLGLGLYQCRVSLAEWGGTVECVRTEPGKGTTFRVELPPAAPRAR